MVTQCFRGSIVSCRQGGAISETVLGVIEDPRTLSEKGMINHKSLYQDNLKKTITLYLRHRVIIRSK